MKNNLKKKQKIDMLWKFLREIVMTFSKYHNDPILKKLGP